MVDEVTDSSNREQVAIRLRWIDSMLMKTSSDYTNLVESIGAYVIVAVLLRLNLSFANCGGQCYDGAANMAGIRTGKLVSMNRGPFLPIVTTYMGMH